MKNVIPNKKEIIDIKKGSNSTPSSSSSSDWDIMSKEMRELVNIFFYDKDTFIREKPLAKLTEYIKKHDRLLYTVLSDMIYENFDSAQKKEDLILSNIDSLLELCDEEEYCSHSNETDLEEKKRIRRIALKIKDHVNLAIRQYRSLKQTDEEYKLKFDAQIGDFKQQVMKDITAQLVTLVGIFTAIAFILFGGINSFENIFTHITKISILTLILISCIWMLGMIDIVFVFLLGISKMTNLDIGNNFSKSTIEKYICIFWFNAIFISIILISLWIKFILYLEFYPKNLDFYFQKCIITLGSIVISFFLYWIFSFLIKKTIKKYN